MLIEFTIFGTLFFVCVAIRSLCESIRDETKRSSVARRIEREAKRRKLELKRAKLKAKKEEDARKWKEFNQFLKDLHKSKQQ